MAFRIESKSGLPLVAVLSGTCQIRDCQIILTFVKIIKITGDPQYFCPPDRLICGINWGTLFHSLTSTFSREVEAVTRSSASVAASETAEEKDCSADANSAPWLSSESEIFLE